MSSLAPIVNWNTTHEMVVSLHIMGRSNKEIAKIVDMTTTRISQILHDPQAVELVERAKLAMRMKMREEIEDKLVVLAEEGVDRLAETIEEDFIAGSDGKKHQDNVALQLLKGTGFLSKDFSGEEQRKQYPLSEKLAERLVSALEKANEAEEIAPTFDVMEAEIVE